LMVVVVFFAMTNSLFKTLINASQGFKEFIGSRFYLPDYIGYTWAVLLLLLIFFIYALVATWNEETDKFTVEM